MSDTFIDNLMTHLFACVHGTGIPLLLHLQREQSGGSGKNSGGPRGRGKTESGGQLPLPSPKLLLLLRISSCADSTRGSATKIKEIGTCFGIGW